MDELERMARDFYGYGRWDAPYWFIGLEQGGTNNDARAKAFRELQSNGLCDCKRFHEMIGVEEWHGDDAEVQKTWGRLMMLLLSFLGSNMNLLEYQCKKWGAENGETCVIELNGLSAAGLHIKVDRKTYLSERINIIRRKLIENSPQLVVMYGFTGEKCFREIAGCNLPRGGGTQHDKTLFLFADHPARQRRGNTDKAWRDFGVVARARKGRTGSFCSVLEEPVEGLLALSKDTA